MKRVIAVHTLFDSQPDGPVYIYVCMHVCIYVCMFIYIVPCLTSWYTAHELLSCHHGFDRYVANVICENWTTLKNGLWPNVMFPYK